MQVGLMIPRGWKDEYAGWDPGATFDRTIALTEHAEHGGRRGCYWGQARTMSRSSVMSSIAQRSPSRPWPESFTPPYGM
mgnify:CR=1 FL=1